MEEIAELHELRRKDIGKLNRCKLEMTKYKIGIEKILKDNESLIKEQTNMMNALGEAIDSKEEMEKTRNLEIKQIMKDKNTHISKLLEQRTKDIQTMKDTGATLSEDFISSRSTPTRHTRHLGGKRKSRRKRKSRCKRKSRRKRKSRCKRKSRRKRKKNRNK